jgi:hypothetical protein
MANLVLEKNGEFWEVFDADRGVTVFSATNQGVALAFIANNDDSISARQRFAVQDINYQGGVATAPAPVNSAQNPQTPSPEFIETGTGLNVLAEDVDVDPAGPTQESLFRLNDGQNLGVPDEFGFVTDPVTGLNVSPEDLPIEDAAGYLTEFTPEGPRLLTTAQVEQATAESSARDRARQQQTISQQRRQINNGDWRVRLRLAPASKYLYNAPNPGILQPLQITDGMYFSLHTNN